MIRILYLKFMKINISFLLVVFLVLSSQNQLFSQDPMRLQAEVNQLDSMTYAIEEVNELVVLTGSSSIRKWDSIAGYFPEHQIINTGFGGSQMSDLLFYIDPLILKYNPYKVFIYEGDNDIAWGKNVEDIMSTTDSLVNILKDNIPDLEIIFISAKPSPARWELKDYYLALNRAIEKYCVRNPTIYYLDVWHVMLGNDGKPIGELFVADSLHMSTKGYELWANEIINYLK